MTVFVSFVGRDDKDVLPAPQLKGGSVRLDDGKDATYGEWNGTQDNVRCHCAVALHGKGGKAGNVEFCGRSHKGTRRKDYGQWNRLCVFLQRLKVDDDERMRRKEEKLGGCKRSSNRLPVEVTHRYLRQLEHAFDVEEVQ